MKERKNNVCAAVKRGVTVRWNCNVFNLAMENVLKDLPDKIRDQLSRHHTQNKSTSNAHKPSSTCVFRNGLISISDWVFGNVWSCSTLFIMKMYHKSDELTN